MPEQAQQFIRPEQVIAKLDLVEGMQVADLGCGNLGYFIIPIAKLIGKKGKAYAVDILKSTLNAVSNQAKLEGLVNLETVWANLEKPGSVKIPDKSLDLALLINVLFQNKDHSQIIKQASRLLKPGAKLVIIDWKKTSIPFGPPVEIRVEPNQIKQIAAKLDLKLIEQTELGDYFWELIFEKK